MNLSTDGQDSKGAYIRKRALPSQVPGELNNQQEEATFGWLRTIWNKVRGLTASEARRLKEAAVHGVEGEAAKRMNEARKLDAEAQLKYALAEEKRREAALKELEYERQARSLQNTQLYEDVDRVERIADATERLADAISRIRQMGGDVAFDSDQFEKLLGTDADELQRSLRPHEETAEDQQQ